MKVRRILLLAVALALTFAMSAGPVFAWHISSTTTGYLDSGGNFVAATTIPQGKAAVDSATVDPVVGCSGLACGHVVFTLFNDGDCGGTYYSRQQVAVASPIAPQSSETVYSGGFTVTPGSWSFRATWVFYDGSLSSTTSSCEPFNVPTSAPEFPLGMAALLLIAIPGLLFLRKRRLSVLE